MCRGLVCLLLNYISHIYKLQSTEVKNSNAMELESLKRQLLYLESANVKVTKLVTDRHNQVSSFMASEKKDIEHAYDVWHVAKGMWLTILFCTKASLTDNFISSR